jgi:hypothetical protein
MLMKLEKDRLVAKCDNLKMTIKQNEEEKDQLETKGSEFAK